MALKLVGGFTARLPEGGAGNNIAVRGSRQCRTADIEPPSRRPYDGDSDMETPMSADPDLTSLDELPDDARELIAHDRAVHRRHPRARRPAGQRPSATRRNANVPRSRSGPTPRSPASSKPRRANWPRSCGELVDSLPRDAGRATPATGKLDEALAIRARVRQLRGDLLGVRTDPGNLTEFNVDGHRPRLALRGDRTAPKGASGAPTSTPSDSRLAAAAVHAGALREGERGLVRVTALRRRGRDLHGHARATAS